MVELFPEYESSPKAKGKTCRSCDFRYKHEYGKMYYCKQKKDPRTAYGDKKIKAGDPACPLFKQK